MPDLTFDLQSTNAYVQSHAALHAALSDRKRGQVLEMRTLLLSGEITLYLETASLYLIGFGNARGQIMSLDGDDESFHQYLAAKFSKTSVHNSGIKAKYTNETWKLQLTKATIEQTIALRNFGPGDTRITESKKHIDRLAYVIAEAARYLPIRCAVACVLHDDHRFLAVLKRLCSYSQNLIKQERKAAALEPGQTLSPRDAHLRDIHPTGNIHVFEIKGNSFDGLSNTERWFKLLSASENDLKGADRERFRSLPTDQWYDMSLGDFENLVKNWSKLSASKDLYIQEIIQESHVRHSVGSSPEDGTKFILEWH